MKGLQINDIHKILIIISVLLVGWLIYLLETILTPFAIAVLLAYLCDPIVDRLEQRKLSRSFSVVIVFTVMTLSVLLLMLIVIPMLQEQLAHSIRRIPIFLHWIQDNFLPYLQRSLGISVTQVDLETVRDSITQNWRDIGNLVTRILIQVTQSGQMVLTVLSSAVLVPVVTFYLLRDWDIIITRLHELLPRKYAAKISQIARECDRVLGEFLHGQLLLMLVQATLYSIGLWIIGLETALLIGLLSGLVSFVPYLGFIIGICVAGISAFMQFQELLPLLYVCIVFFVGQILEGMILSPWLVGDRIGLHPVAVIFAVMAGGQLFGIVGVLLALPVAAVIVVLLRHAHQSYVNSRLYTS